MHETKDTETSGAQAGSSASQGAAPEYVPSPSERVRDQVARYEATGGAEGGELAGLPVIILTTVGAQDGPRRHRARAREVSGDEKQRWWAIADALNPNYAKCRSTAGRDIPILVLESVV
jgi:F420H(2)-dependent quinone reductase